MLTINPINGFIAAIVAPTPSITITILIKNVFLNRSSFKSMDTNVNAITTIETAINVFDIPKNFPNIFINIEFAINVSVFIIKSLLTLIVSPPKF